MGKNMKYYHLVLIWLVLVGTILASVGLFNYIVDPYQQYRKATFYPILFKKNQRYINPGLAKTYDYNSVLVGSSMTENFIISEIENSLQFGKTIKFCISGATSHEEYQTLKTAFRHKKIENVLYGFDIASFIGDPDRLRHGKALPSYLYDESVFNDYQYLLNLDIITASLRAIIKPFLDNENVLYNYNYMWQWQHEFENKFGKERVLNGWHSKQRSNKKFQKELWNLDKLKLSFNKNLLSLIKENPETEFTVFYPPYSILTFYDWNKHGVLESSIVFKRYVFEQIKKYKNVKLYDFQVAKEIILDLDNYKDYEHYHQKINTWMLYEISKNHFRVTEENVDSFGKKLKDMVNKFKIPKER